MKPEYDFSKGERGKFFRADGDLRLPIYLSSDVQRYLTERAARKGVPLGERAAEAGNSNDRVGEVAANLWSEPSRCGR
jgi:hypothetical protein